MPISYDWLIPQEVVGLHWTGHVMDTELAPVDDVLVRLCDQTPHPLLHFISDERDLLSEPSFPAYLKVRCVRHKKFGWYFIVQRENNLIGNFIAKMANSVLKVRLRIVTDPADAWHMLQRLYPHMVIPTLSDEQAISR